MMSKEENIKFFEANLDLLQRLIGKANGRRIKAGMDVLGEEEIDDGIGKMILMAERKEDIRTFEFPAPIPVPQRAAAPIHIQDPNAFRFEITKCANGFTMNLTCNGTRETFIFKSNQELSDIFKELFFKPENKENENGKLGTNLATERGKTSGRKNKYPGAENPINERPH